ncbi:MAG: SPOR domain-containing protein [Gemmatimonadota bacterium]
MTRYLAPLAALIVSAASLAAQNAPPLAPVADSTPSDTLFLRAQRMAAEGHGDAARALVQHEIDASTAGSPRYVDAIYWRAVVAATASDAEKDLRRIIIEFPLSPRNEDALLRLAQLEMTRGDNDQALAHLQRLVIDHPTSPSRARASFWMARVYFDKNQTSAACRTLADAAHNTTPAQVEQKNQIDFWMQRCHGNDTSAVASSAPVPATIAQTPVPTTPVDAAPVPPAPQPRETEPVPPPSPPPVVAPPRANTTMSTKTTTTAVKTTTVAPHRSSGPTRYTVQVAAYDTRNAAVQLQHNLIAKGLEARIVGTAKPFRVRVGYYDTRAKAEAAAAQLKAKQLTVYVTEAEAR